MKDTMLGGTFLSHTPRRLPERVGNVHPYLVESVERAWIEEGFEPIMLKQVKQHETFGAHTRLLYARPDASGKTKYDALRMIRLLPSEEGTRLFYIETDLNHYIFDDGRDVHEVFPEQVGQPYTRK